MENMLGILAHCQIGTACKFKLLSKVLLISDFVSLTIVTHASHYELKGYKYIPIVLKILIPSPPSISLLKPARIHFLDSSFDTVHTYLVWAETYDRSERIVGGFECCVLNRTPADRENPYGCEGSEGMRRRNFAERVGNVDVEDMEQEEEGGEGEDEGYHNGIRFNTSVPKKSSEMLTELRT